MNEFVNQENTKRPDNGKYSDVIAKIQRDGVCPFCPENLATYHKNPTITEGSFWLLTKNMYPYEGTKHHILVIHKEHIESFADIAAPAWEELRRLIAEFTRSENIPGGAFLMRFGDPAYTGASVRHLHANLISKKEGASVIARVG